MSALSLILSAALSVVAIEHVKVEVGDGRTLDDVTVVMDGGAIVAIGPAVTVPGGAQRIDGKGKVLTPGFVELTSHLGLIEVEQEDSTHEDAMQGLMVPAFRAAEGFNPLSVWIPVAREEGVTSLVLAPDRGVLSGLGYLAPTTGTLASMPDLSKPLAMFGDVGRSGANAAGGSHGAVWLKLREALADARHYAKNRAVEDLNRHPLALPLVHLEALQPVLAKKLPLVLTANRAADIVGALRFAKEEGVRVVIAGGGEAWLVAAELAKAQVPVVLVPSSQVPGSFEQLRARDDAATRLDAAGVPLVLACSDSSQRRLRQEAGIAVAYGLPRAKALATITLAPAKALGLDKELGTVEAGKRADVVLWSGDPLELSSIAERVFIGGEEQPKSTRQTRLVERYLK